VKQPVRPRPARAGRLVLCNYNDGCGSRGDRVPAAARRPGRAMSAPRGGGGGGGGPGAAGEGGGPRREAGEDGRSRAARTSAIILDSDEAVLPSVTRQKVVVPNGPLPGEALSPVRRPHEWESGIRPCLHPALQDLDVPESLRGELRRLTGGRRFLGSSSVENDPLILGEGWEPPCKLREGDCALQVEHLELFVVLVATDKKWRVGRDHLCPRFLDVDANSLDHGCTSLFV